MRTALCALALMLVWGCDPPRTPAPAPEPPPSTTPSGTPTKQTTPTTDNSQAQTKPDPAKPDDTKKPGYKVERIHQLSDLETAMIEVDGKPIKVWVMDDESKMQEGMMFLKKEDVSLDDGMLFVFPDEAPRKFWMKNTLIDLDLAYIGKNGSIGSVHHMKALDENGVPGLKPAKYVLEMRYGAFAKHGVKAGSMVKLPANISSR